MPGRDGTGPLGMGPIAGRGTGRRYRRVYYMTGLPCWARYTDEITVLKNQENMLERKLKSVKERLRIINEMEQT